MKTQKWIHVYTEAFQISWERMEPTNNGIGSNDSPFGKKIKLCPYTLFSEMKDLNMPPKSQTFRRKCEVRKVFLNKSQPDIYINKNMINLTK